MGATHKTERSRRQFLKVTGQVAAGSALLAAMAPGIHAGEDNTVRLALVGCGGRGAGAAANAMATKAAPVRLVAMADVFEDRLQRAYDGLIQAASAPRMQGSADSWVMGYQAGQVDVPPERRFLGFDAYRKAMECLRPGDVVILTTPVAFRWVHFRHAIEKGINVFMEKPVVVDGPSTRRMLDLAEQSQRKGLKVGVGLMCRHCKARHELLERIHSGQIGDLITFRTYRQQGPAGFTGPNQSGLNELLWQVRNYLSFMWASGGLFQDYVAHNVDECCWMKGSWPVRVQGSGGRCFRGDCVDQNYDHYDVEYTFADGAKLFLYARSVAGCRGEFASYAHGSKGCAVISTNMHTPAKCRIYEGQDFARERLKWAFPQPEPNPYQLEWDALIEAIRDDKPFNEAKRGTEAGLVTAMARRAVHTGQVVTYEEMLNCEEEFARDVDALTMDSPAPVQAGPDGVYPGPQPGRLKDREY
ncbi:MAG TPA: gfo/Idh/MocA family oxidoreductase [Phycisphaerales bacterium]|nr:gfo/Idh/MocA family oxidoreductase [Phycisphaerales bacterium]